MTRKNPPVHIAKCGNLPYVTNSGLNSSEGAYWTVDSSVPDEAALLTVSKRKLGITSDELTEIIDLRIAPENMDALIDKKFISPAGI